jgi:hypothetical protein
MISYLTRIETKTFSNKESNKTVFIVNKTPIENSVPNYDLFTAFSSMNNLKKLDIEYTNLKEHPDLNSGGLKCSSGHYLI